MGRRAVFGLPGYTSYLWNPSAQRPSGSSRNDTLPMTDEEKEEAGQRERERKARGFGFNPQRAPDPEPKVWEGDGA